MTKESLIEFVKENAPCYVYEKDVILQSCKELQDNMPSAKFLYSIKANPFAPVIKTISSCGIGADAASSNEVLLALQEDIDPSMIFYSAPGKTMHDIDKAWGKCTFIADSFHELDLLEEKASSENMILDVGIRIHPKYAHYTVFPRPSKFGIDEVDLFETNWKYPHLNIVGIHIHLMSQLLISEMLIRYHKYCYELAKRVDTLDGVNIKFINFGSGIAVVYDETDILKPNLKKLGKAFEELAQKNNQELKADLYIETGRYLVCKAGTYFTPIVDKKDSYGATFLIVQNGTTGFLRPAIAQLLLHARGEFPGVGFEPFYTSKNQSKFTIVGKTKEDEEEIVDIVGSLCTALDLMASDISLPEADIGDILAISNAGSYAYTLSPFAFSSPERPKEYLL